MSTQEVLHLYRDRNKRIEHGLVSPIGEVNEQELLKLVGGGANPAAHRDVAEAAFSKEFLCSFFCSTTNIATIC